MKKIAFIYKYIGSPLRSDFTHDDRRHALELEEAHEKIIKALKRKYEVRSYSNLWPTVEDGFPGTFPVDEPFDFIITHVPYDSMLSVPFTYRRSLRALKKICEMFPEAKIIAYTGAHKNSVSEKELKEHGVSHVIRKFEPDKDLEEIPSICLCISLKFIPLWISNSYKI